jgi:hypothetical protein
MLVLGYERGGYIRETWIRPHHKGAEISEGRIVFGPTIAPQGSWSTWIEVVAAVDGTPTGHERTRYNPSDDSRSRAASRTELGTHPTVSELIALAPKLETDWDPLKLTYARSLVDLAALRFYPREGSDVAVPAAGLPWFQTLFGRDSLITSYQALHIVPELAANTLDVLASLQGTRRDDFRDEEPGKILHELRFGELTAFQERPHSPYYGSADGTMLFLILLDEYERFTGDTDRVRRLEPNARAALAWIDEYGGRDGDGYVEYERRNTETGLENQCWKDSWNSILFSDGTLAKLPRATCELQGYVYDARLRCARLAREIWNDDALAQKLEHQADELKQSFNEDFWLEGRGYYALALDGDKKPVDALTSNIGHLLWSGIVDDDRAEEVVAHLLGPRLFSGWGVRTMAEGDGGYNPIGYHQGTVWPHDNSLIADGLRRYGYHDEAATIASRFSRRPSTSSDGFRKPSPATSGPLPTTPSSTRPRAVRRPGPRARRSCCCASCSASKRGMVQSSSTHFSRSGSARSLSTASLGRPEAMTHRRRSRPRSDCADGTLVHLRVDARARGGCASGRSFSATARPDRDQPLSVGPRDGCARRRRSRHPRDVSGS